MIAIGFCYEDKLKLKDTFLSLQQKIFFIVKKPIFGGGECGCSLFKLYLKVKVKSLYYQKNILESIV